MAVATPSSHESRRARMKRDSAKLARELALAEVLPLPPDAEPRDVARAVGLRYVRDDGPGIRREWTAEGPVYFSPGGRRIEDAPEVKRLNALAVPPAYREVWICPDARGHIQATGRDARGRKQYRYHARWREVRDATKFERMLEFGRALPGIRARVADDLERPGMPREKVLATVLRLLETTLIRVGNEEYARENRSYGLTTLRTRHVRVNGSELRFSFRGKSGRQHDVRISDRRIARIVRQCMDLPGQELFQYLDEEGERRVVDSSDVNDYLRGISGSEFTAKDYRTWAGSVLALAELTQRASDSPHEGKGHVVEVTKLVAERLGNTPAVCRKCYIHPGVIDAFQTGALANSLALRMRKSLNEDEARLLGFLERRVPRMRNGKVRKALEE
jgi:DNA topoisomerase-1